MAKAVIKGSLSDLCLVGLLVKVCLASISLCKIEWYNIFVYCLVEGFMFAVLYHSANFRIAIALWEKPFFSGMVISTNDFLLAIGWKIGSNPKGVLPLGLRSVVVISPLHSPQKHFGLQRVWSLYAIIDWNSAWICCRIPIIPNGGNIPEQGNAMRDWIRIISSQDLWTQANCKYERSLTTCW